MIHAFIKFEDAFSGCIVCKIITASEDTFQKMLNGIGSSFSHFDKVAAIRSEWVVKEVRQATEADYKTCNVQMFTNQP